MCRKHYALTMCLIVAAFMMASGCRKKEPPAQTGQQDAEVSAKLAKADAYDGTEDKIVEKCAGCALGMDGSEERALHVLGYELHFCSEACVQAFEKDTTEALLALKIPEE